MYCVKCGKEVQNGRQVCDECLEAERNEVEVTEERPPVSNGKALGFGIASLACGVYGLINLAAPIFALALGIVAVCLSKVSMGTKWEKLAKPGKITGTIAIIAGAILTGLSIILGFIYFGFSILNFFLSFIFLI